MYMFKSAFSVNLRNRGCEFFSVCKAKKSTSDCTVLPLKPSPDPAAARPSYHFYKTCYRFKLGHPLSNLTVQDNLFYSRTISNLEIDLKSRKESKKDG